MNLLRPLPRSFARPLSLLILVAWVVCMVALVQRSYLQASPGNLATDLARYGPTATWRGVYYRGEKIGFAVSQTVRTGTGFELQEDARLELVLLGATSTTALRTTARVDETFALESFAFSLDPGTGAVEVTGRVERDRPTAGTHQLVLAVTSTGGTRTETRPLTNLPVLNVNFSRMLASRGLRAGTTQHWTMFDPATLRNAPVELRIGDREAVRTRDGFIPAFRVDMSYQGLNTTAWVTDTGDIVREESPLGLMTLRESPEDARALAVPGRVQQDLLRMSAVVPTMRQRIDEPRDVRRIRLRLTGFDRIGPEMDGAGQTVAGNEIEIVDPRTLSAGAFDPTSHRYLSPEPLIESDAPEIVQEAQNAIDGATAPRTKAERLTRYVNALLEKKPTVSLPSALEVLRTKIGDCNEHTALYVAMARAVGIPARIAVGLAYVRGAQGAFYYHAWPEVYLEEENGGGLWLPVDPTLNQFPADATHLRLVRGGLDQQAAIVPLIGQLRIAVLDLELDPQATPILVGRDRAELPALPVTPTVAAGGCGCDE